ncbi:MAG: hypothetical protein CMF50_09005 [Legionellales bacterium]|nr:hypothetical protein [Legionellales bacterium]|tara:strand:- start:8327 stop:10279 length:1953 start_codon:yes stop_codon:yes gene_type:complete
MTLKKQLILVTLIIFSLVFCGAFVISVKNFQTYLSEQLDAEAQNTASSLGATLSQYTENNDMATISALLDSVFKSGNYQEIGIVATDGKELFNRELELPKPRVPGWFRDMAKLDVTPGNALVMAGWKQFGEIYVVPHIDYAYKELWDNTLEIFGLFVGCLLLTWLLGAIILSYLLRPLQAVKQQADSISSRQFTRQDKLPVTKELRSVVEAMNNMSMKVEEMFHEQASVTDKLREQIFKDPYTGLANKKYFMRQLTQLTDASESSHLLSVFILEFKGLDKFKARLGYEAGDSYLTKVAKVLESFILPGSDDVACRLGDDSFGLLVLDKNNTAIKGIARNIQTKLNELHGFLDLKTITFNIGIAHMLSGETSEKVLSVADMALRSAESQGVNSWEIYTAEHLELQQIHTASQWREIFADIVNRQAVQLYKQPVHSFKNGSSEIMHQEILMRLYDEQDKVMNAGLFIPMAEMLGVTFELDKLVVMKTVEYLSENQDDSQFAINLSADFIKSDTCGEWLIAYLQQNQQVCQSLVFEFIESVAITMPDDMKRLTTQLRQLGCGIGLDHVGRGFTSLKYLRQLQIDYLKIDATYIRDIPNDRDNQFIVHLLTEAAHNFDIKVLAVSVENETEVTALRDLHVNGGQGYYFGKPIKL